uniref:Uncharacterized protein n=1 Tax=Anguilla anguilla TaxID=7936 RepID=A0A0E9QKN9_ANGAN
MIVGTRRGGSSISETALQVSSVYRELCYEQNIQRVTVLWVKTPCTERSEDNGQTRSSEDKGHACSNNSCSQWWRADELQQQKTTSASAPVS